MKNLKIILKSRLVCAVLITLIVLSAVSVSVVSTGLKNLQWQEDLLEEYDWVIPLGLFNHISVAELNGQVYFIASPLPEGILPWELYDEGYIQFADSEKTGIMDRKGNVIVPPGFAYVRNLEKDCVVVVLGSECGVIRIGGNRDEG